MRSPRLFASGLAIVLSAAPTHAENDPNRNSIGTQYSTCKADTPMIEFRDTKDYGYLGEDGVCVAAGTVLPDGYRTCASGVYNAFTTDTDYYYDCALSREAGCPGGCPDGSQCVQTTTVSGDSFYLCGLQCAEDFYLCSDDAAKQLGGYTAYCDATSDQCGTCASYGALTPNETYCSDQIYDVPQGPYTTAYLGRRSKSRARRVDDRDLTNSPDCPVGLTRCQVLSGNEDDYECLDVKEELEACGACPGAGGIDCSALPGTESFSATCHRGACVAHDCTEGYYLNGTVCILEGEVAPSIDVAPVKTWEILKANTGILKNAVHIYKRETYKIEYLWQLGAKPFWNVQLLGNGK